MALNFLYALDVNNYLFDIRKLLQTLLLSLNKVCYVSLDKTAQSVEEFCKDSNIPTQGIFIVDMISPKFKKCENSKHVDYVNVENIEEALKKVIKSMERNKCEALILDSISSLRIYSNENDLLKFSHQLITYANNKHLITNIIIQKKDIEENWAKSVMTLTGPAKEVRFGS